MSQWRNPFLCSGFQSRSKQVQISYCLYTLMSKSNKSRTKRGAMLVNLIETPAGYSIIEGTELLNRPPPSHTPPINSPPINNSTILNGAPIPIIKEQKFVMKQKNLVFVKAPTEPCPKNNEMMGPRPCKEAREQPQSFAEWFSIQSVHPIQINELKLWQMDINSQKFIQDIDENDASFCELIKKYRSHRNTIIDVYYRNFWPNKQYMSASRVRKYISDDAYWLMKIHIFLTNSGIINQANINFCNEKFNAFQILLGDKKKSEVVNKKNEESSAKTSYQSEQQLLNYLTYQIRPLCDFCGIKCSYNWFQHIRQIDSRQIQTIMKNVNSKNPPLSQKQYEIILCINCYCNGSFPLLLTHQDFKKVSVNDSLEPNRKKKKEKKHKRKEKKKSQKNKERMMEAEEEIDGEYKQYKDENQGQKQEEQPELNKVNNNIENSKEKQNYSNSKEPTAKKQNKTTDPNKEQGIQEEPKKAEQEQNPATSTEIIADILGKLRTQHKWNNQQTLMLLTLIEKYEQNWEEIGNKMRENGFCQDCTPQDLIKHFILLPKEKSYFQLDYQYEQEQFIRKNEGSLHKTKLLQKITQKNYQQVLNLQQKYKQISDKCRENREQSESYIKLQTNKERMNEGMRMSMKKIEEHICKLEKVQKAAKWHRCETQKKMKGIYDSKY